MHDGSPARRAVVHSRNDKGLDKTLSCILCKKGLDLSVVV